VLIIGTLLIYSQLSYIQSRRLGFDQSQLLYIRLKGDMRAKAMLFKSQVEKLAGVAQASAATSNLVEVLNGSRLEWEGKTPGDEFNITHMNVDADFLQTTGMSVVTGRNFSTQITTDTSSTMGTYLINETAARRMGWTPESALGKKINFWGADGKVIGVLKDFHFRSLHVAIEPFILRFRPKDFYFTLLVRTHPNQVQRTLADISGIYKKLDPDHPVTYGFVDQDLAAQYMAEQRTGRIILSFSVLTILVSCLGLFGLATFTAEQRTKEIGIRKVLGASVASLVGLLSGDFMRLVVIAFVIAVPIAWYAMHQWLQNFSFRIGIGWWYFAAAGVLAVCIALIPVGFQAIKAALADPATSLRSE
jgi:ABC-type antimicrobial peptide transport system permease subunit